MAREPSYRDDFWGAPSGASSAVGWMVTAAFLLGVVSGALVFWLA